MPTQSEHEIQAKKNEEFVDVVLALPTVHYCEWATTAVFYAAVHYGRALAVKKGATITSHGAFAAFFVRECPNETMYKQYRRLQTESEKARYDCRPYSPDEVVALRDKVLAPFRVAVKALL